MRLNWSFYSQGPHVPSEALESEHDSLGESSASNALISRTQGRKKTHKVHEMSHLKGARRIHSPPPHPFLGV